jgi:hypothetical protein
MTAAFHSEPDTPDPLSRREQRILASIEDELRSADPRFASTMDDHDWTQISLAPAHCRRPCVALSAVLLLLVAGAMMPASWWATVGLLTFLLTVPWLLFGTTRRDSSD